MKKHGLIAAILAGVLFLAGCKKEETIIQQYNPPQPKLYGVWKVIQGMGTEGYFSFPNDGSNYAYILQLEEFGFRSKNVYVYSASDKQLILSGSVFNYAVKGDTLNLEYSPGLSYVMVKEADASITHKTWLQAAPVSKSVKVPERIVSFTLPSFGIDGNDLYISGYNGNDYGYKYNTLTEELTDSILIVTRASFYHKSGALYYGFDNMTNKIFKGNIFSTVVPVSNNNISNVRAISANPNSGVVYAMSSDGNLYSGTDNSTFNALVDLSEYNVGSFVYYKNDEFLCVKNGSVHRVKITPDFEVLATYETKAGFNVSSVSTNGTDTYVYGWNNTSNKYEILKVGI